MKLRVMVIDDLDSARQMVKRALSRSFDVYDFASVAEALRVYEAGTAVPVAGA